MNRCRIVIPLLLGLAGGSACDRIIPRAPDETLPDVPRVEQLYDEHGIAGTLQYSGNVVELIVQQPIDQLRRGGELWARVGPYIYLFSPATRELFEQYAGIAAVRVITRAGGDEVARAMLVRDALNEIGWRRATAVLSHALEEGTTRPSTLDRLVQFGEEHTQFAYSERYVPPREGGEQGRRR